MEQLADLAQQDSRSRSASLSLTAQATCMSAHTRSAVHEQQCAADSSSMHAIHEQASAPFALRCWQAKEEATGSPSHAKLLLQQERHTVMLQWKDIPMEHAHWT